MSTPAPGRSEPWTGSGHNYLLYGFLILFAALSLWRAEIVGYLIGTLLLVIAHVFSWVRVTVDEVQVEVALGIWRWPKKSVALNEIQEVSTMNVQPLRYGGWGYRVCGRHCRAIVVRRGGSLKVTTTEGKVLIVTVDDAEAGVTAIKQRRKLN